MWREIIACSVVWSLSLGSPKIVAAKSGRRTQGTRASSSMEISTSTAQAEPTSGPGARQAPEILNKGEMLSLVRKYTSDIADAVLDGEKQREAAVRTKDSIRLSCIQDRLSNMKAMKKLSDDRFEATQRPRIQADELNLRHEFRGVELAHERVTELHMELMECAGENLEVTITGDGNPSTTGATAPTDPAGTNVEVPPADRPPPASTYQ